MRKRWLRQIALIMGSGDKKKTPGLLRVSLKMMLSNANSLNVGKLIGHLCALVANVDVVL